MVNINESMSNVTREGRGKCWLSLDRKVDNCKNCDNCDDCDNCKNRDNGNIENIK